jgi:hypothetical protein
LVEGDGDEGTITRHHLIIDVNNPQGKLPVYDGYFVAPGTSDGNDADGSPQHPFTTFEAACERAEKSSHLYIRGGIYTNPHFGDDDIDQKKKRFTRITECNGTENAPFTITPWGNEAVKILFDSRFGLHIKNSEYLVVEGLEIEGVSRNITLYEALDHWWYATDYYNGVGITSSGDHIVIKNNIVHDTPGCGIQAYGGGATTIKGNVVYNTDWWTISGSKGIGITQARYLPDEDNETFANVISENLIVSTQQRIMSRVWAKGFATLTIDEGEAFLVQEGKRTGDDRSGYTGRYLIENNLVLYNGKTGVVNLADRVTIRHNSYYGNGYLTGQGGFRLNGSDHIDIVDNAVDADETVAVVYSAGKNVTEVHLSDNIAKGKRTKKTPEGIDFIDDSPFVAPEEGNFTIRAELSSDAGIDRASAARLMRVVERYGIVFDAKYYDVNRSEMTKYIVEHAPEGTTADYSHYDDDKPYIVIQNLPDDHPVVKITGEHNFTLYTPYKFKRE